MNWSKIVGYLLPAFVVGAGCGAFITATREGKAAMKENEAFLKQQYFEKNKAPQLETISKPDHSLNSENREDSTVAEENLREVVSHGWGYQTAQDLQKHPYVSIDMNSFLKGFNSALAHQQPLYEKTELETKMMQFVRESFEKFSTQNLKESEAFLQKMSNHKEFVFLEEGKVCYKVEQAGEEIASTVQEDSKPTLRYTMKTLDGTILDKSLPEGTSIDMKYVYPGFLRGLIGAKVGEKRTIYIHPALAAGENIPSHPNSLISFDVEVLNISSESVEDTSSDITPAHNISFLDDLNTIACEDATGNKHDEILSEESEKMTKTDDSLESTEDHSNHTLSSNSSVESFSDQ